MTDATDARHAALRLLRGVADGTPFDTMRDRVLPTLTGPDRALVYELSAGVLRNQCRLDEALAPLVRGRWDSLPEELKAVLRLGGYQLWHLDRIPAYAAVATSVSLARTISNKKGAGLINAVLRRAARIKPEPGPRDDSIEALALWHCTPLWLVERWDSRYGSDAVRSILGWNDAVPDLYLQPLRESPAQLLRRLVHAGMTAELAPLGGGVRVVDTAPTSIPGYAEGKWLVQDPAQALALAYAEFPVGETVYDVCAAPGGKAAQLGVDHCVIAGDRSARRLVRLRETLIRTAVDAHTIIADAAELPVRAVDGVLLDAPCTGTGSMRRHPDARHRLQPDMLKAAVAQQRVLLEAAAGAVRRGGLLVYVTCSIEPEENRMQIEDFLKRHRGFQRRPGTGPDGTLSTEGDLTLLPHVHGTDGAYAARLQRTD